MGRPLGGLKLYHSECLRYGKDNDMLSLASISALDAFLAGIARSISMYTRDIDFEFTLIEVMRYETPNQTVQHAHQRSIRPAISYVPDDALTRLSSLFDEDEFAAMLSSTLSISGCIRERVGQAFKQRLGNYHDIVLGTGHPRNADRPELLPYQC
jgi:hypothetical protein